MSGVAPDPLDRIEKRVLRSETRAVDVLALVEVARAGRRELRRQGCLCLYSRCPIHGESEGDLAGALARLEETR